MVTTRRATRNADNKREKTQRENSEKRATAEEGGSKEEVPEKERVADLADEVEHTEEIHSKELGAEQESEGKPETMDGDRDSESTSESTLKGVSDALTYGQEQLSPDREKLLAKSSDMDTLKMSLKMFIHVCDKGNVIPLNGDARVRFEHIRKLVE